MPIEFLSKHQIESKPVSQMEIGSRGKKATPTQINHTDNVSFSDNAKLFMEAKQAAQAAPDVRVDKIEALRPLVQAGNYTIDSHNIAAEVVNKEPGLFI